ncbi:AraC family transcriptional regulator [Azohydromonas sediminis]|uniref:AraC family transcriptional regulator n=1 Tax=Azohydromonas sediminis TaxID=2259674 RepID=UPI0013C2CAB4|nr:AraC family transcriptional regulator [Azohydromonas sediminis]
MTVSARIGAMILGMAEARGVAASELMAATGFDPHWLDDADARMPLAVETRLWDEAARRSGDACFGLHAALAIRPGMFQVLDYAVRTAPDLGSALQRLARYNRLVHDVATFDIQPEVGRVRIVHRFESVVDPPSRHAVEFTLASLVVVASQIGTVPVQAAAVEFAHCAPACDAQHRALFGVAPRFAAPRSCLMLEADLLRRRVPAAEPELSRIVTAHAERLLAERGEETPSWSTRVRCHLLDGLAGERASLTAVARRLGVSERSLQRRLHDEGFGFAQLLDDVRHDLARRYVTDTRLSLGEVAYLLGFSEPSAFHRAFRRWTGTTARNLRRHHGAADPQTARAVAPPPP